MIKIGRKYVFSIKYKENEKYIKLFGSIKRKMLLLQNELRFLQVETRNLSTYNKKDKKLLSTDKFLIIKEKTGSERTKVSNI